MPFLSFNFSLTRTIFLFLTPQQPNTSISEAQNLDAVSLDGFFNTFLQSKLKSHPDNNLCNDDLY